VSFIVFVLGFGALLGFWLGVHWAERGRAKHDMERTWAGRQNWRK